MKIIPYLFIVLGIMILLEKHKLLGVDFIYPIIYCLCGYGAIGLGILNVTLDLGFREFLIRYNLYYQYHFQYYFSFVGGILLGWGIILIIIETKIEKQKRRKIKDELT